MQQSRSFIIAIVGCALLFALACILPVVSHAQDSGMFDKYRQCKIDCNEAFGGLDVFPSERAPQGHAECILKCERKFWRNFDKDTQIK